MILDFGSLRHMKQFLKTKMLYPNLDNKRLVHISEAITAFDFLVKFAFTYIFRSSTVIYLFKGKKYPARIIGEICSKLKDTKTALVSLLFTLSRFH